MHSTLLPEISRELKSTLCSHSVLFLREEDFNKKYITLKHLPFLDEWFVVYFNGWIELYYVWDEFLLPDFYDSVNGWELGDWGAT
jgi:hypothetical protein